MAILDCVVDSVTCSICTDTAIFSMLGEKYVLQFCSKTEKNQVDNQPKKNVITLGRWERQNNPARRSLQTGLRSVLRGVI